MHEENHYRRQIAKRSYQVTSNLPMTLGRTPSIFRVILRIRRTEAFTDSELELGFQTKKRLVR